MMIIKVGNTISFSIQLCLTSADILVSTCRAFSLTVLTL